MCDETPEETNPAPIDEQIVNLKVGDCLTTTVLMKHLLSVPNSKLFEHFSDPENLKTETDGYVRVDRDPEAFATMLDYLKADRETVKIIESEESRNKFTQEL